LIENYSSHNSRRLPTPGDFGTSLEEREILAQPGNVSDALLCAVDLMPKEVLRHGELFLRGRRIKSKMVGTLRFCPPYVKRITEFSQIQSRMLYNTLNQRLEEKIFYTP